MVLPRHKELIGLIVPGHKKVKNASQTLILAGWRNDGRGYFRFIAGRLSGESSSGSRDSWPHGRLTIALGHPPGGPASKLGFRLTPRQAVENTGEITGRNSWARMLDILAIPG